MLKYRKVRLLNGRVLDVKRVNPLSPDVPDNIKEGLLYAKKQIESPDTLTFERRIESCRRNAARYEKMADMAEKFICDEKVPADSKESYFNKIETFLAERSKLLNDADEMESDFIKIIMKLGQTSEEISEWYLSSVSDEAEDISSLIDQDICTSIVRALLGFPVEQGDKQEDHPTSVSEVGKDS